MTEGVLKDAWIGRLPSYDAAPIPARGVQVATLQSVVTAIGQAEAIEVKYQSLSRPEPRCRWIAPHALAFDGFRWHTRAFCIADQGFKDFLLLRIIETPGIKPTEIIADADSECNEQVALEIGPHPDLSKTQQKVIALDYGIIGGKAIISVRKALLYYALRRLSRDTDHTARRPQDQQIVLLNHKAVFGMLSAVSTEG